MEAFSLEILVELKNVRGWIKDELGEELGEI